MIRILLYLVLLAGAASGLAWFADNPGTLTVNWLNHEAEISVFAAAIMLLAGLTAAALTLWFALGVINAPRRIARNMAVRRRRRGFKALQDGIFAVGAGDDAKAAKFAAIANKYVPNRPLTRLLRAQAAQLTGDRAAAQRIFTSLLDDPETKMLGLRGLYMEAKREGQLEAARHYAQDALAINPSLPWPAAALFDFQCRERDWNGALATVSVARQHRLIDRRTADRRRAVLLTALAMESEERGDGKAMELALEAHRLAPDFTPAAGIAGRALAAQGQTSRAGRVIAAAWEHEPHPDLATAYAYARPGDSPRDRLIRVKSLASITPGHAESAIAVASAAIEARAFDEARIALDALARERPTARVCALMARIEGGERRDAGRVREWLARALRAPRDPAWIADGVVSDEWAPLSPVTETFDAFAWRIPPEQHKPHRMDDRLLAELARLEPELHDDEEAGAAVTVLAAEIAAAPARDNAPQAEAAGAPPPEKPAPEKAPAAQNSPSASPAAASGSGQVKEAGATPAAALGPYSPSAVAGRDGKREETPPARPDALKALAPPSAGQPAAGKPAAGQPATGQPAAASREIATRKKQAPQIFVPARPPDDPGPGAGENDEPVVTPLSRYRTPMKDSA